jgi:hypothetical protein
MSKHDRLRSGLRKKNNAKIIHGKVVLVLVAIISILNAFHFLSMADSFIPFKYIIPAILRSIILIIPGLLSFKYPRLAFIVGASFGVLLSLNNLIIGEYFSLFFTFYILGASIIAYQALDKKETLNPKVEERDDILDSGIF